MHITIMSFTFPSNKLYNAMTWVCLVLCASATVQTLYCTVLQSENVVSFTDLTINTYCTNNNFAICTDPKVHLIAASPIIFDCLCQEEF